MNYRISLSWFHDEGQERGAMIQKVLMASNLNDLFNKVRQYLPENVVPEVSELRVYEEVYAEVNGEVLKDKYLFRSLRGGLIPVAEKEVN